MSKPVELEAHQCDDHNVMAAQERIKEFVKSMEDCPLLDGVSVKDVEVDTSKTKINHGLGRKPEGWIITKNDASYVVFETTYDDDAEKEIHLNLVSTGSGSTIDLWVY